MNPFFYKDFYKIDHISQYPKDTEQVWSNWTARSTRVAGVGAVRWFGYEAMVKRILIDEWQKFFWQPLTSVLNEYREVLYATLGVEKPRTDHIEYLHQLGYLPLDIYTLPEGSKVPLGVPMLVVTNTDKKCFWLPNSLETVMSAYLWKPTTSATTAKGFRDRFIEYAKKFGEKDFSFVDWQGHDFCYRGMSGNEDAIMSGMGHLLSFNGTDTIPAILAAREYYGAPLSCGGSVPATEHSVMCAGGMDGEFETFKRLITETYPSGIVSIVSDTWNLWKVLVEFIPRLKNEILARNGKVVIRPDSGDPVKIVIGDPSAPEGTAERDGAAVLLARALGTDGHGHINKGGLIYGDGISPARQIAMLQGLINKGLSPYNLVLGIGSYTYEYVTRDEYGFAMKATAVMRNGQLLNIFKSPVTSQHGFSKASAVGIPIVYERHDKTNGTEYFVKDHGTPLFLNACSFTKTFSKGKLLVEEKWKDIVGRVRE